MELKRREINAASSITIFELGFLKELTCIDMGKYLAIKINILLKD